MEGITRWLLVTAVAPVTWGTTYYVTGAFLPPDRPLYGAAIRALPAGLLLLALSRTLPSGSWWWKSLVLGVLNMGGFFALVYLAAQRLPASVASTVMAAAPLVMMLLAWPLVGERPRTRQLAAAVTGVAGVCLMLLTASASIDPVGVLASACALAMSCVGYLLAKRWNDGTDTLASTSWQLTVGGLVLLAAAAAVEGSPPALDGPALAAFAYITLVGTALAFVAWFAGLRRLPAATVGLVGLLNPVTGVLLGTALAHETLTVRQLLGLALTLTSVALARPAKSGARAAGGSSTVTPLMAAAASPQSGATSRPAPSGRG
ncbi:EamA family transporter [Streptomyces sp. TRM66268-LWL]|uniref:EamA family transporter n=1 Tax=Streptomyces polyasparticus TaxID=2767826 RepID=A0ABR7STY1_9ACTN|nr:EamA family transporter [Streptomyces polyasparticus]MBC9718936.1 EamA family transporter [Streptomyces polyasparticus]